MLCIRANVVVYPIVLVKCLGCDRIPNESVNRRGEWKYGGTFEAVEESVSYCLQWFIILSRLVLFAVIHYSEYVGTICSDSF
jgi:hypothetical protein